MRRVCILLLLGSIMLGQAEQAEPVLPEQLKKHVQQLCATSRPRNYRNQDALNEAADYIKTQFSEIGLKPEDQLFEVEEAQYRNIIARIEPSNPKGLIIVGAHYDVCGNQPGADDNGSGTAGLIELARLLYARRSELHYTLEFAAYALEEPPFFGTEHMGSAHHAAAMKEAPEFMLCLEMIGYFNDEKGSQAYPLLWMKFMYPDTGNFIAIVGNADSADIINHTVKVFQDQNLIPVESLIAPAGVQGVDFSDHRNYWTYGYKAFMVTDTAFYRNTYYHTPFDKPDTLDYKRMAAVVKSIVPLIIEYEAVPEPLPETD